MLYDRDALLDELNADFSIVNQWIAAQPEIDPEQALRTAAAIEVAYTAFNSIDGNEHYPMDCLLYTSTCRTTKPRTMRATR